MKHLRLYVLLLVSFFITSCEKNKTQAGKENSRSQIKNVVTTHWPDSNKVHKIKNSRNGSLLIATSNGVFRFDGRLFTNTTSTLGSHKFWDALDDQHGNTWITSNEGVYYFTGKSFQHFTTRDGLANDTVFSVYEDKAGMTWFGTHNGLSRYDGKSFQNFIMEGGRWSNVITSVLQDKTGKLWVGTRVNVFMYDGKKFTPLTDIAGRSVVDIWSIIEDKKGNIWMGGYDGLKRYDGKTLTGMAHNPFTYVPCVIQDKTGNIWTIGKITSNGEWAVSRYDEKSLYSKDPVVTDIMLGGSNFIGLSEAKDGSIWFGYAAGLFRYNGKMIRAY